MRAVRNWGPIYTHLASKALKALIFLIFGKAFASLGKWIPRTSSQVCGLEAVEVLVRLPVSMCHRWDWSLHLGMGRKVEISCWSSDETLKGCHEGVKCWFLWAKDSCFKWLSSLTSPGYGRCLLKVWEGWRCIPRGFSARQAWIHIRAWLFVTYVILGSYLTLGALEHRRNT